MAHSYNKIEAPKEDTVIFGDRTLRQIVAIMDRLKGILEAVDIPGSAKNRRSIFSHSSHVSLNSKEPQWTIQHLFCYDDLWFRGYGKRPEGWSVWDMQIAHHFKPYTKYREHSPRITSENLGNFLADGEIAYVIAPHYDARRDLDALEILIAKCDQRLATIGEWVRLDLCMRVECTCGRTSSLDARDRFHMISESRATLDVVSKMRCTACGASDVKRTTAFYRGGGSALWNYSKDLSFHSSRGSRGPLDELHINAGGDGENAAYLGDGLYVDPDGTLHD